MAIALSYRTYQQFFFWPICSIYYGRLEVRIEAKTLRLAKTLPLFFRWQTNFAL